MREQAKGLPYEARADNLIGALNRRETSALPDVISVLEERAQQFDKDPAGLSHRFHESLVSALTSSEVRNAFAGTLRFTLLDGKGQPMKGNSRASIITKELFKDPSAIMFAPHKFSAQKFSINTMKVDLKGISEPTKKLILLTAFYTQAFVRLIDKLEPLITGKGKDRITTDHKSITNPDEFWRLKLIGGRNNLGTVTSVVSPGIAVCAGFIHRISPVIDKTAKEIFGDGATDALETIRKALELDGSEDDLDQKKPTRHSMFMSVDQIIDLDKIPVTEATKTEFGKIVRSLLIKFGKPEDRDKIATLDDGKISIAEPLDPNDPIYELDFTFHETDEEGNYTTRKYELNRNGDIEFSVSIDPPPTEERKKELREFEEATKGMSPQEVQEFIHNRIKAIEDELSPGEIDWENSEVVRVLRREARAVQDERVAGLRIVTEGELRRVIEALKIAKPVI